MNIYPLFPERKILNLNGEWDFNFIGDAELVKLDPAGFEFNDLMSVPGAFDSSPAYYCRRGVALYRTGFTLDADCGNALLKLGGLGLRGRFWIDGREAGFTELPYSGIEFETGKLAAGPHVLAAALDNRFYPDKNELFQPFYDFYAFGGFYRGVELQVVPETGSIDRVQVRTLDYRTGKVGVRCLFRGMQPETIQYRFDGSGEFQSVKMAEEIELTVSDFKIWSPESPALHTIEIKAGEDRIVEMFGIREIKTGNKSLMLNGKPVYLKGFNRHESHPQFGPATPLQVMIEDLQNLKDLNCNFVRGAHYPQDQRFLQLCDRLGIMVWEESLGWGNRPESLADAGFMDLQERQTRLMVRNSINHPSVIIWGFLNEFHSESEEGYELCKRLVRAIKDEDNSRVVTFACNHTQDDICHELVDIIAYNTYPGWISNNYELEPPELIKPDREQIIKYFRDRVSADKPIMVSEMGCCAIYGQRDLAKAQWTEEFQAEYLEAVIKDIFSSDDICGLTIWQFTDAKSYLRKGANIRAKPFAQNLAGVFDQYRRRKFAADTVKKLFAEK